MSNNQLSKDKYYLTNLEPKIHIDFKVGEDGSIADIDIKTLSSLTKKEAIICREEITKLLQLFPQGMPAYKDLSPVSQTVGILLNIKDGFPIFSNIPEKINPSIPSQGGGAYNLSGRASRDLIRPNYPSYAQGRVVVEIVVNPAGYVVQASYRNTGSTTNDSELVNAALAAARSTRFNSTEGATNQTGTITYNFIISN